MKISINVCSFDFGCNFYVCVLSFKFLLYLKFNKINDILDRYSDRDVYTS